MLVKIIFLLKGLIDATVEEGSLVVNLKLAGTKLRPFSKRYSSRALTMVIKNYTRS